MDHPDQDPAEVLGRFVVAEEPERKETETGDER